MTNPILFLSHSSADKAAVIELKKRVLQAPEAREAGLKVWLDKDDLSPGGEWQEQLENAVSRQATAFAVYVGSNGIINWVGREVRLALERATRDPNFLFIPILALPERARAVAALPPFAQQHHGVTDPLRDPAEFTKLINALINKAPHAPAILTDEPFVGLRAMTEKEADRFFGRDVEIADLVKTLRGNRLVAIVADSGAGKSSLAMAGLIPAWRGGALANPLRLQPSDRLWHAIVMRPGGDPLEGLRRGVTEAAERMGLSPNERSDLRRRLSFDNASESAFALRCDLPASSTETLLIIDQFDELLTQTPEAARAPFIGLLLQLASMASPGGFRVVLTVRVDYFNLCRPYSALYSELLQSGRILRLKRISDAGLTEAVLKPLQLAGYSDDKDAKAFTAHIHRDLGDRPGDLALAQMALWTVWRNRKAHDASLLQAYVDAGGVTGALAQVAERVRVSKLNDDERSLLLALFVRLIRLGETGGATRRLAAGNEFEHARYKLAQKLATEECGRLLLIREGEKRKSMKVEVCHEQLITQWPWLQNALNAAASDLRALERLTDRALEWFSASEGERSKYLPTRAEWESFVKLSQKWGVWLSETERCFVAEYDAAEAARTSAERRRLEEILEAQATRAEALAGKERALHELSRRTTLGLIGAGSLTAVSAGLAYWGVDAEARFSREQVARQASDRLAAEEARRRGAERTDIRGQVVAYSASPGQEAMDGDGNNSPYTASVITALLNPNTSLQSALALTNAMVLKETQGRQRPFYSTDMNGEIFLFRQPPTRKCKAVVVSVDGVNDGHKLKNPERDAISWQKILEDNNFSVSRLSNPSRLELLGVMDALTFNSSTRRGELVNYIHRAGLSMEPVDNTLVIFFYSGFGFSSAGQAFIVPRDATTRSEREAVDSSIALDSILKMMREKAAASVVVSDTNFENPWVRVGVSR